VRLRVKGIRNAQLESDIKRPHDEKEINARQYAIVTWLLVAGKSVSLIELRKSLWYQALYVKLTDKTKQRDLKALRELGLVIQDDNNQLCLGAIQAKG